MLISERAKKVFIAFDGNDWHYTWEGEFAKPFTKEDQATIYDMKIGQCFHKGDNIIVVRVIG